MESALPVPLVTVSSVPFTRVLPSSALLMISFSSVLGVTFVVVELGISVSLFLTSPISLPVSPVVSSFLDVSITSPSVMVMSLCSGSGSESLYLISTLSESVPKAGSGLSVVLSSVPLLSVPLLSVPLLSVLLLSVLLLSVPLPSVPLPAEVSVVCAGVLLEEAVSTSSAAFAIRGWAATHAVSAIDIAATLNFLFVMIPGLLSCRHVYNSPINRTAETASPNYLRYSIFWNFRQEKPSRTVEILRSV